MAFAVVCKSCNARFLLNDDLLRRKVAGRVVTVRCRQCHAAIEVDASDVDPKTLPETEKPAPPTPVVKGAKPAPPRPVAKSTLMGIGGPPRPAGATELVALSPGLLNVGASPMPPATAGPRGFPEPPPPPDAVQELSSADWEVPDSGASTATSDAVPESVDDFIEELPPSLPPPDEELPSSTGTPSLKTLAHHEPHAPQHPPDDFLANMSAAMNGGRLPGELGAPTIDVSSLSASATEAALAPSIDVSLLDAPLEGKQTLPLFALMGAADPSLLTAPAQPLSTGGADGSLSPATLDHPARQPASESVRERKNVVAPSSDSRSPAAGGQRRSGLAAPVLLALAAAAGFLIWRRTSPPPSPTVEPVSAAALAAVPTPPRQPELAAQPTPSAVASSDAPAPTEDDVTFETAPAGKPTGLTATPQPKPSDGASRAVEQPAPGSSPPAEPKPEPPPAAVKEEPQAPPPPAEPAGPFDRAAAAAALTSGAAQASACRKEGDPSGVASVVITFAPSGRVTSANVSGPPFAGTATGGCIASALRKAHIPPFEGDRVTVSKTIVIQ